jgi:hypothetical protein
MPGPGVPPGAFPPQGPPGQYFSPGDAFTGPPPPPVGGMPPPGGPVPWTGAQPPVPASGASASRGSQAKWVVIVALATVVLLGILAAVYFLVLNKSTEATGPEKTVVQYFDALSSGDTAMVKTLFTPETVPDDATLQMLSQLFGAGMIKYENVKCKTLSETATDAEVQLEDVTIIVSMGGQSVKQKLSDTGMVTGTIKLKNVNGAWLINQKGNFPGGMDIPALPGGSTITPSDG